MITSVIEESLYSRYLSALLQGDRVQCAGIVKELQLTDAGLKDLYINLFQRSLYEVGELWEHQHISVAVEHLATAITQRVMTLVQPDLFSGAVRDRTLIVSCIADEYHQLGARMVADLAEIHGWRSYFLGANTPLNSLLEMIDQRRPDLVGLSLSVYFNMPSLERSLDAVVSTFPGIPLVVGGQAFRECWGGTQVGRKHSNVVLSSSLDTLEQVLIKQ